MAIIWACIPLANTILFAKVPIAPLIGEGEKGLTIKELYSKKLFWPVSYTHLDVYKRQRPTKATISSRPERVNGHIGTETRPKLCLFYTSRCVYETATRCRGAKLFGAAANAISSPPGEYVRKNETQRN